MMHGLRSLAFSSVSFSSQFFSSLGTPLYLPSSHSLLNFLLLLLSLNHLLFFLLLLFVLLFIFIEAIFSSTNFLYFNLKGFPENLSQGEYPIGFLLRIGYLFHSQARKILKATIIQMLTRKKIHKQKKKRKEEGKKQTKRRQLQNCYCTTEVNFIPYDEVPKGKNPKDITQLKSKRKNQKNYSD